MKNGDTVYTKERKIISTNAELLNYFFNCNLNGLQRAAYPINFDTMVWMVTLNNIPKDGWKNKRMGDLIIEEFVGNKSNPPKNIDEGLKYTRRIVFEKIPQAKCFVFRGVYELNKLKGSIYYRVLEKVSDEFNF